MKIKAIFRSMLRRPLRCFLIILSVAIGVSSVICILKASDIAKELLEGELNALGMDGITISCTGNDDNDYLDSSDLKLLESDSLVEHASPTIVEFGKFTAGGNTDSALIWGVGTDCQSVLSINIIDGVEIGEGEINNKANCCLISKEASEKFFNGDAVGKTISLKLKKNGEKYTVIGVIEHTSGILENVAGEFLPEIIYIPYTSMQQSLHSKKISQISLKLKNTKDLEGGATALVKMLNQQKGSHNIKYTNLTDQRKNFSNILNYASIILFIIACITLLVAGIAVMTTMFSSINERKHEIGIKKAIGAKFTDILLEFLLEAIIITVLGSLTGITITACIFTAINLTLGFGLTVDIRLFVYAILLSVSVGCVFGIVPAISAAKQNPMQCLSA